MSKFCTNCGATLDDDAVFCPECGARFDAAPAPEEVKTAPQPGEAKSAAQPETAAPQQTAAPAPAPVPVPVPEPAPAAEPAQRSKEVSTAGFFWLMLVFAIPVIGLIVMLVFAFIVKNKNLRHFARACLIWILVALILSLIALLVLKLLGIDLQQLYENIQNVTVLK